MTERDDDIDWDALIAEATRARENAHAPYSGFAVGAAVRSPDGQIFAGCNMENASYGLSLCAERSAVGAAVTAGVRQLVALVVVTDTDEPTPPCGMCRQVLAELPPPFAVRCRTLDGRELDTDVAALLPWAFRLQRA